MDEQDRLPSILCGFPLVNLEFNENQSGFGKNQLGRPSLL